MIPRPGGTDVQVGPGPLEHGELVRLNPETMPHPLRDYALFCDESATCPKTPRPAAT